MERLKTGVYKDIYNYNPKVFKNLVRSNQQEEERAEEHEDQEE
jgi:hypothetical protein